MEGRLRAAERQRWERTMEIVKVILIVRWEESGWCEMLLY